jgi:WD40 repeat protein
MLSSKTVVCISTTKPSSAITPSGGGGSLTVLCPQTGSVLSSLRTSADLSGKTALGMSSLSIFPKGFSPANTQLVLSFGGNGSRKGDSYAMLLAIRAAPSAPILHWKCRLPEAELAGGMIVSPCGHYIVGGGASGSCYVWSSLGGKLLKTFKAHYRACTCLAWSECGRYLVTGGADGMVHLFPLIDLVDITSRKSRRSIAPLHTWSVHHFPVTCLSLLDGGRIASAAQDGHVAILELFSKVTLAKIKLPHPIESLAHHDSRLYAGSDHGTIYSIDLNAYAMHQTEKQGATLSKRMRKEKQAFLVAEEKVFGKEYSDENETLNTFQTEWIGHEHAVSSLAVAVEDMKPRLISGDRLGEVRIWDIESRTCLNTLRPWSNTAMNAPKSASQEKTSSDSVRHPIASIVVFRQPSETDKGMFSAPTSSSTKSQSNIANLLPPLQKYTQDAPTGGDDDDAALTPVPFLRPNQTEENLKYWEARPLSRKRKPRHIESPNGKSTNNGSTDELRDSREQIATLQKELEQKRIEIMRWEKVNNKLMTKMKSKS